jgi:hypothetical protein
LSAEARRAKADRRHLETAVTSPFDELRVTLIEPQRHCTSSVILSLSKETRATTAGEGGGGPI